MHWRGRKHGLPWAGRGSTSLPHARLPPLYRDKLGGELATILIVAAHASTQPRVFCMEWLDPVSCSGHWVPEMVALTGGRDALDAVMGPPSERASRSGGCPSQ